MSTPIMAIDFETIGKLLQQADVLDDITYDASGLSAKARQAQEPAYYRISYDQKNLYIGLYIKDRWLSESIETDLLHSGDTVQELLEEEMADQGLDFGLPIEHFRSPQLEYVFRSKISHPAHQSPKVLSQILLSYHHCFVELGDMSEEQDPLA